MKNEVIKVNTLFSNFLDRQGSHSAWPTGRVCARLTRLCVESAGVEKVSGEVDVDVAEKKQHVASLPGSGPDVKTPSPRKLFVQLQQSVVLKMNFPAETQRGVYIQETRGHLCPVYSKQKAYSNLLKGKKKMLHEHKDIFKSDVDCIGWNKGF